MNILLVIMLKKNIKKVLLNALRAEQPGREEKRDPFARDLFFYFTQFGPLYWPLSWQAKPQRCQLPLSQQYFATLS